MNDHHSFPGVMVSSTFTDLAAHRAKLNEALNRFDLHPVGMESSVPRADRDVLQSSLAYVAQSAAYICIVTHKYGQIPPDPVRNPQQLSLTELEFNEARRRNKPRLLFLMGDDHPVKPADVERDPVKLEKLAAFRDRAKTMGEGSEIHCVYSVFNSLEEFAEIATAAVGHLANLITPPAHPDISQPAPEPDHTLPRPPSLYARPGYAASHRFVGRAAELQTLADWSAAADPNPMLLFEAIGGTGKSMLTWQFLTQHATTARPDWAGRFWYSFYEKGADMSGFCRHALAYFTGNPPEHFDKQPTHALAEKLLAHLQRRPFLLVLDGIERILVAYHSLDAAGQPDEAADTATDQISNRKPRQAIRPDDDDLLPRLAAAAPSKILVSTRLTPLCLINKSDQPIAGVRREPLRGLRPPDAEAMLLAQGVTGNSADIRAYLQTNCDCHPLVIGALAGLINKYRPDPGNFDRWSNDPAYGANLNLSALDLVQRRNHILAAAIESLPPSAAPLLHILALLPGGADYEMLSATLPPGSAALDHAIDAIEEAGLLQYDRQARRYDLHPVVRGVALGRMQKPETESAGTRLIDHFNSQPHSPWENAESLADLEPGLRLVQILLRLERFQDAFNAYAGDLARALRFNLNDRSTTQALLQRFFPNGWQAALVPLPARYRAYLFNEAAWALDIIAPAQAWHFYEQLITLDIELADATELGVALRNIGIAVSNANRFAECARVRSLSLALAEATQNKADLFVAKYSLFIDAAIKGNSAEADRLWPEIESIGSAWPRHQHRPGDTESWRAWDLFYRGALTEQYLSAAQSLAAAGRNRLAAQELHYLRGLYHLSRNEPRPATIALAEAIRLAAESHARNIAAEALHPLARLRAGDNFDAHAAAERLGTPDGHPALHLAELWHECGDPARATEHALRAHRYFVADGEPYVHRYWLNRTHAVLTTLNAPLPEIPTYDPATAKIYSWEADVQAFIEKLRTERAAKQTPNPK